MYYAQFVQHIITLGGILLIIGALFMYFGKVYISVWMYLFADVCWSINSFYNGDAFGAITVSIGLILGMVTMYKMHTGIFYKQISKDVKNTKESKD